LFSPVPILFKGPGFYVTDSREESGKTGNPQGSKKKEKDSGGNEK